MQKENNTKANHTPEKRSARIFGLLVLLLTIALIILLAVSWSRYTQWQRSKAGEASVVFLDVGQGDGVYIRTSDNQDIVIDGGPSTEFVQQISRQMRWQDSVIELVIISHADADHITGLVALCERYQFAAVVWAPQPASSNIHQALTDCLEQQHERYGMEYIEPIAGDTINLNEREQLHVLYPFAQSEELAKTIDKNDYSIVAQYQYTGDIQTTRMLFTGDLGVEGEAQMISAKVLEDIDVLKIGHHGSSTSTSVEFLQATKPEWAVIQVGKDNTFGHPHAETLNHLLQAVDSSHILRNDTLGSITFRIGDYGYTY